MSRKPQQRTLETRARLLQTARDLSSAQGLETLTAEGVAKAAGVAKGTLFAHFGDMDGLLSHVLKDRLGALRAKPADSAETAPRINDPVGLLMERMMALIEVITDSPVVLRLFMDNIGVTKPNCATEFVETLDALDAELAGFLAVWQSSDSLRPALRKDRSPEEMVDGLIAFMIHGAILRESHQMKDRKELQARLRRHVEAFLLTD